MVCCLSNAIDTCRQPPLSWCYAQFCPPSLARKKGDRPEPRQMLLRSTGTGFNSKWSFTRSQDLDPKQVTYPSFLTFFVGSRPLGLLRKRPPHLPEWKSSTKQDTGTTWEANNLLRDRFQNKPIAQGSISMVDGG